VVSNCGTLSMRPANPSRSCFPFASCPTAGQPNDPADRQFSSAGEIRKNKQQFGGQSPPWPPQLEMARAIRAHSISQADHIFMLCNELAPDELWNISCFPESH